MVCDHIEHSNIRAYVLHPHDMPLPRSYIQKIKDTLVPDTVPLTFSENRIIAKGIAHCGRVPPQQRERFYLLFFIIYL